MSQNREPDFFEKNWFEQRKQERLAAAKRRRRRDAIFLGVLLAFVVGGFTAVKIVGAEPGVGTTGPEAVAPSPSTSAYDPDVVALGLAKAVANVMATEPNTDVGIPRVEEIRRGTEQQTGCVVSGAEVETAPTKSRAKGLGIYYASELGGGQYAVQRVAYAEPDWEDQFIVVVVKMECR